MQFMRTLSHTPKIFFINRREPQQYRNTEGHLFVSILKELLDRMRMSRHAGHMIVKEEKKKKKKKKITIKKRERRLLPCFSGFVI